jgi:excisionase family DNA binding protein
MTLTVGQVADVAEVPPRTVRDHIRRGRLRAEKVGRDWLVDEASAGEWVKTYRPYDTLRGKRGRKP